MNCGRFKNCFSAYIDGELPVDTIVEIEAHLESCPSCSGMLKSYRDGVQQLHRSAGIEPPDDMFERVMAEVDRRDRQAKVIPLHSPVRRKAMAAAAIVAMALAGSLLFTGGDRVDVAWSPAVDSTIDVVNAEEIKPAAEPVEETSKRPAQKAYLASYGGDEEPSFSYGVSKNPVLVESGIGAAE